MATVAALASGLPFDARIHRKRMGLKVPYDTYVQTRILDLLHLLLWSRTRDAEHGRNRPEPLADGMIEKARTMATDSGTYEYVTMDMDSAREYFEKRRKGEA